MREIKFRVRDRVSKKIIGYESLMPDISNDGSTSWGKSFAGRDWESGVYGPAYYYLREQVTGLHDKNGKEIYEGDVVRGFDENEFGSVNNDGPVHAKVIWWENSAGFQLEAISPSEILHSDMAVNVEIIGNIYEHPELLTNK